MTDNELDNLVRHSLQRSPGQAADAGVWLLIEDPAVLASLSRQRALEQFWFGVLRNPQGQVMAMDVCLQQLLQALPFESLNESLRELRLAADLQL